MAGIDPLYVSPLAEGFSYSVQTVSDDTINAADADRMQDVHNEVGDCPRWHAARSGLEGCAEGARLDGPGITRTMGDPARGGC
jgi:hypothetical protein